MLDYTVVSGDCLSSIAARFRLPSWKTIYDLPENAEFKRKRPNPNLIYPGDLLKIPVDDPKTEKVQTDQKFKFKLVGEKVKLVIYLKDDKGKGVSGKKFKLEVGDDFEKEGKTSGDGKIDVEIPGDENAGSLHLWLTDGKEDSPVIFPLEIGALDPIEEITGVKARLANLGYQPGAIDDADNDEYKAAVREFQQKNSITPVNGTVNDTTRSKLKEVYGS